MRAKKPLDSAQGEKAHRELTRNSGAVRVNVSPQAKSRPSQGVTLNTRIAAVAVLSAALVAGGTTAANAAPVPHSDKQPVAVKHAPEPTKPAPEPTKHAPAPTRHDSAPTRHDSAKKHAPASSISISASATRVRAGDSITFSGSTTSLSKGSTVTLQEQDRHGRWVSLDASTTVDRDSSYSISATLGKGTQTLRVVDGDTTSSSVTVVVY
jgi:hypothetical protein